MLLYLPGLIVGLLCLVIATRLREQGKEREAGMLLGLALVLIVTSVVASILSLVGVF